MASITRGKILCLATITLLVFFSQIVLAETEFPELRSIAIVVYDADYGLVVYEKNMHARRSIASLTKIMTLLYACELVENGKISLDDVVTASANAASREGTQIRLKAGDKFTVEELLYATALSSANDAAVALAEYIAGSEKEFARMMSTRARELGINNTNFVDATGLLSIYDGNYSTAYELAILSTIAMQNDLFRTLVSTKEYELKAQGRTIKNTNSLLHDIEGVNGIKTGSTTPAGHTLVTSVIKHNRHLIIVVLGAPSREVRNEESEQLLNWAFSNLEVVIRANEVVEQLEVPDGVDHLINVVPSREISFFFPWEDLREFEQRIELSDNIRAPVDKGDKVGEIIFERNGEEFARADLVAAQGTGLASFLRRIFNVLRKFFINLFS